MLASDGAARLGTLTTAHGVVETPAFMPVGTYGTVKAMTADGITDAVEFGGRVLMGLMRRIDRNVKVRPLEDLASLKSLREQSERG